MQVLVLLAAHPGQVIAKERLILTVWPDAFVTDDVLTRAISELRRVFGDDAKEPRFIQTIPKSGYRLIALVSSSGADADPKQAVHLATVTAGNDLVTAPAPRRVGPAHTNKQSGARGRWAWGQSVWRLSSSWVSWCGLGGVPTRGFPESLLPSCPSNTSGVRSASI